MNQGNVCVVHLVRKANDLQVFSDFIGSYRRHPAGVEHELLVIFKGLSAQDDLSAYDAALEGIPHQRTFVADAGYDVGPYLKVARDYDYRHFLFLNSFSRIQSAGWLEKLYREALRPGIGIVGATGSYQSNLSNYWIYQRELARTLPAHKRALLPFISGARYLSRVRGQFAPFPNYHVRTNAFLVSREVLGTLQDRVVQQKWDAYRFESGINGMTRHILSTGLGARIVGANGQSYEPADWPEAETFWIGTQENLLISDNQTRAYDEGPKALRDILCYHAWRRYPDGRARTVPPVLPKQLPRKTSCPQCGALAKLFLYGRDFNQQVTTEVFLYYRCRGCSLVFLRPVPPDLERYYPSRYHEIPQSRAQLLRDATHEEFKLRAVGQQGRDRRLLEIGPSYGRFAALAKDAGFRVQTIEMDKNCCAFLQNAVGVDATHADDPAEALRQLGRFDVVALWHSIEHLKDPWPLLDALPDHIEKGGLLAIASPNPQSLQFRFLKRDWVHLDAPRHVSLIPPGVLERRLASRGMRLVHLSTRDQGALDCNLLGWLTWSRRRIPSVLKRWPLTAVGYRLLQVALKLEQHRRYGSAYTVVFEKIAHAERS